MLYDPDKSQFNESYQEYYRIIENALNLNRVKIKNREHKNYIYYERHHIIPRSLGGSNKITNLVLLTPEEHYICHSLLPDFCEGASYYKMVHAWNAINNMGGITDGKELLGVKKYGELKRNHSKARKDFYQTEEGKKIREWLSEENRKRMAGFYQTEEGAEQAKNQSNSLKKYYQTEEGQLTALSRNINIKAFYETEEGKKIVAKKAIQNSGKNNCNAIPVFQLDKYSGKIIKEWDCVADADKAVSGASSTEISSCARGRYALAGNYIWIYKEDYSVENVLLRLEKVRDRKTGKKGIIQIDKSGKLTEWASISEAARSLNIDRNGISNCARGKRDDFKGSVWKFKSMEKE